VWCLALETHNPHNFTVGAARLIFEKTGLHLRIPNLLNKLSEILTLTLYSLCDFKEHNTKDIRKGYLSGRYGSIPFLANLKDLNWDAYDIDQ
jgi:hypothetical protein